jgi:hypothetical protein
MSSARELSQRYLLGASWLEIAKLPAHQARAKTQNLHEDNLIHRQSERLELNHGYREGYAYIDMDGDERALTYLDI